MNVASKPDKEKRNLASNKHKASVNPFSVEGDIVSAQSWLYAPSMF